MGNFRIVIEAIGDHGQDREKKDGEVVDFGSNKPESIAKEFVEKLKSQGSSVTFAKVFHWPNGGEVVPVDANDNECITDDLITGIRKGQF